MNNEEGILGKILYIVIIILLTVIFSSYTFKFDDEVRIKESSPNGKYGLILVTEKYDNAILNLLYGESNKVKVFITDFTNKKTILYYSISLSSNITDYSFKCNWNTYECELTFINNNDFNTLKYVVILDGYNEMIENSLENFYEALN